MPAQHNTLCVICLSSNLNRHHRSNQALFIDCLLAPEEIQQKFRIYNVSLSINPPTCHVSSTQSCRVFRAQFDGSQALLLRLRLLQDALNLQPSPRLLKRPSLYPISRISPHPSVFSLPITSPKQSTVVKEKRNTHDVSGLKAYPTVNATNPPPNPQNITPSHPSFSYFSPGLTPHSHPVGGS